MDIARERAARRSTKSRRRDALSGPAPLPEVVGEGNTHADWSQWEDSMSVIDSTLGDLPASQRVYERESDNRFTRPSPLEGAKDGDVFGTVGKNRDV